MKTNVTMRSQESRELYGVVIRQETKDKFLSLTDLQEAYTHARVLNGWGEKKIQSILSQKVNTDKIYFLLKERNLINLDKKDFDDFINTNGIVKYLKKINMYKCYGRGDNKVVFCDKFIWLLICQEMNTSWYADVIQYLFTGKFSQFDFVDFDASEYEITQQARLNHEKAWKYFYPEGNGKAKEGYCLHHINPDWRYNDLERYNAWNPEDLQMLTNSEHCKLHQKIGYGKSRDLEFFDSAKLNYNLYLEMKNNFENPDYNGVLTALDKKNSTNEDKLHSLNMLEETMAYCVKKGFYKTNEELVSAIQNA